MSETVISSPRGTKLVNETLKEYTNRRRSKRHQKLSRISSQVPQESEPKVPKRLTRNVARVLEKENEPLEMLTQDEDVFQLPSVVDLDKGGEEKEIDIDELHRRLRSVNEKSRIHEVFDVDLFQPGKELLLDIDEFEPPGAYEAIPPMDIADLEELDHPSDNEEDLEISELFCDETYGGFGARSFDSRVPKEDLCSWTLLNQSKRLSDLSRGRHKSVLKQERFTSEQMVYNCPPRSPPRNLTNEVLGIIRDFEELESEENLLQHGSPAVLSFKRRTRDRSYGGKAKKQKRKLEYDEDRGREDTPEPLDLSEDDQEENFRAETPATPQPPVDLSNLEQNETFLTQLTQFGESFRTVKSQTCAEPPADSLVVATEFPGKCDSPEKEYPEKCESPEKEGNITDDFLKGVQELFEEDVLPPANLGGFTLASGKAAPNQNPKFDLFADEWDLNKPLPNTKAPKQNPSTSLEPSGFTLASGKAVPNQKPKFDLFAGEWDLNKPLPSINKGQKPQNPPATGLGGFSLASGKTAPHQKPKVDLFADEWDLNKPLVKSEKSTKKLDPKDPNFGYKFFGEELLGDFGGYFGRNKPSEAPSTSGFSHAKALMTSKEQKTAQKSFSSTPKCRGASLDESPVLPFGRVDTPTLVQSFQKGSLASSTPVSGNPGVSKGLGNRKRLFKAHQDAENPKKKLCQRLEDARNKAFGSLLAQKSRLDRLEGRVPAMRERLDEEKLSLEAAGSHRLNLLEFFSQDEVDHAVFEFDEETTLGADRNYTAGVADFEAALLAIPGVDSKLLPRNWVQNHYGMVVWKLAAYERKYEGQFLTPNNVINQLRYRYDLEIGQARRSCLRKILEKDDTACKKMVLMVSEVKVEAKRVVGVKLTDGWYSVRADLDGMLNVLVKTGRIREGTKLMTCCAELRNSEIACHPLEMLDSVRLGLAYNSTRPAPNGSKLGYTRCPFPFAIRLTDVQKGGGTIGALNLVVVRIYPALVHDKSTKEFRSMRQENLIVDRLEKDREVQVERSYNEILNSKSFNASFDDDLTDTQKNSLFLEQEEKQAEISRRVLEQVPVVRREVVPCLRIRAIDASDHSSSALVTFWGTSEAFDFKELDLIYVTYLQPQLATETLKLCSVKNKTSVRVLKSQTPVTEAARTFTSLGNLTPDSTPLFNEVDCLGLVVSVAQRNNSEVLHLVDEEGNFVCVTLWGSCKTLGYDFVQPGAFLSCRNLEWRSVGSQTTPFVTLFHCDHTTISDMQRNSSPRELAFLTAVKDNGSKVVQSCREKLEIDIPESLVGSPVVPANSQKVESTPAPANSRPMRKKRLGSGGRVSSRRT